ncbi:hypothetical protein [Acetobacter sp. DmW_043]|uniref:hypothetical protein n=1 Tax=Acetobacter sp. DmW_043 TaxID=1670658 RepID=UPI0013027BFB|nr:hypothetical protein [Acetobacter sp. DmW_043]
MSENAVKKISGIFLMIKERVFSKIGCEGGVNWLRKFLHASCARAQCEKNVWLAISKKWQRLEGYFWAKKPKASDADALFCNRRRQPIIIVMRASLGAIF